ncbi:remorin [Salvia miltiorrhiza]|uniref:remorin n=1 Tax=Salvia miltiorrhiza TaxID=226208 RepID=UPI0025AD6D99|nr:remorin [Salvia miltiorrhiza]
MMRRNYESDDSDFASAVAASAHAIHIHSLGEVTPNPKIARPNTRKQEPQQGGSMRKASMKETRSSSSFKPAISIADDKRHKQTSTILRQPDSKADAWEKAQIAKIRKRYENLHNEIKAWENEKKLGEKHQIERKKGDLELRKSKNLKHYYNKIARIDHIAQGTRARVEEKRKHEESIVKDKARKMRSTGKAPVSCFCF